MTGDIENTPPEVPKPIDIAREGVRLAFDFYADAMSQPWLKEVDVGQIVSVGGTSVFHHETGEQGQIEISLRDVFDPKDVNFLAIAEEAAHFAHFNSNPEFKNEYLRITREMARLPTSELFTQFINYKNTIEFVAKVATWRLFSDLIEHPRQISWMPQKQELIRKAFDDREKCRRLELDHQDLAYYWAHHAAEMYYTSEEAKDVPLGELLTFTPNALRDHAKIHCRSSSEKLEEITTKFDAYTAKYAESGIWIGRK